MTRETLSILARASLSQHTRLRWRRRVVTVIRNHCKDILPNVGDEDIDWESWRPLFDSGRSPKAAVEAAFLRSL